MNQTYHRNGLNDRRYTKKQVVLPLVGIRRFHSPKSENDAGIKEEGLLKGTTSRIARLLSYHSFGAKNLLERKKKTL